MKVVKYIPINLGIYHSNLSLSHAHVSYPRAWLSLWRNETTPKFNDVLGTDSISHKASYCKISQSICIWNFAGFSAAVLPPRCPIPPPPTPPTHTHTHTHPHPHTHSPHPPTPPTQYESVVTSSMTMKLKKTALFQFRWKLRDGNPTDTCFIKMI